MGIKNDLNSFFNSIKESEYSNPIKIMLVVVSVFYCLPSLLLRVLLETEIEAFIKGDNSMIPDIVFYCAKYSWLLGIAIILSGFLAISAYSFWTKKPEGKSGTLACGLFAFYSIALVSQAIYAITVSVFLIIVLFKNPETSIPETQVVSIESAGIPETTLTITPTIELTKSPMPTFESWLFDDFSGSSLDLSKWNNNKCGDQYWIYEIGHPKIDLNTSTLRECWLIPLMDEEIEIRRIEADFIHENSFERGSYASIMTTCGSKRLYFEFDARNLYYTWEGSDRTEIKQHFWDNGLFNITLTIEWTTDSHIILSALDTITGEEIANTQLECAQLPKEIKFGATTGEGYRGYPIAIKIDRVEIFTKE